MFAALDGTSPTDYSPACQTSYIQLPSGWILAPDNEVSQGVILAYPWGLLTATLTVERYLLALQGCLMQPS